jgi:hypothetical protein
MTGYRIQKGLILGAFFTGMSEDVQNDLIECIDAVIEDQIDKEIRDCQFFSIQCDERLDVSTKEQLSIIVHLDRRDVVWKGF